MLHFLQLSVARGISQTCELFAKPGFATAIFQAFDLPFKSDDLSFMDDLSDIVERCVQSPFSEPELEAARCDLAEQVEAALVAAAAAGVRIADGIEAVLSNAAQQPVRHIVNTPAMKYVRACEELSLAFPDWYQRKTFGFL